jgi:hypothetical protein
MSLAINIIQIMALLVVVQEDTRDQGVLRLDQVAKVLLTPNMIPL